MNLRDIIIRLIRGLGFGVVGLVGGAVVGGLAWGSAGHGGNYPGALLGGLGGGGLAFVVGLFIKPRGDDSDADA